MPIIDLESNVIGIILRKYASSYRTNVSDLTHSIEVKIASSLCGGGGTECKVNHFYAIVQSYLRMGACIGIDHLSVPLQQTRCLWLSVYLTVCLATAAAAAARCIETVYAIY